MTGIRVYARCVIAATVLVTGVAFGEEPSAPPERGPFLRHTYSLTWNYPQKLTCGITGIFCLNRRRWNTGPSVAGIVLQAQPGMGGLRASLGYGFIWSVRALTGQDLGPVGHMGIPWLGYALKATLLRTMHDPWGVPAGQLYAGLTAQANLLMLNLDLGVLRHAAGDDGSRPWVFTWAVGMGF